MMDETDKKILKILKDDSKLSMRELSEMLKIPSSTISDRVASLKRNGVIKRFTIVCCFF